MLQSTPCIYLSLWFTWIPLVWSVAQQHHTTALYGLVSGLRSLHWVDISFAVLVHEVSHCIQKLVSGTCSTVATAWLTWQSPGCQTVSKKSHGCPACSILRTIVKAAATSHEGANALPMTRDAVSAVQAKPGWAYMHRAVVHIVLIPARGQHPIKSHANNYLLGPDSATPCTQMLIISHRRQL